MCSSDLVRARHGHGMASVNQTRPHCVNQMGKTPSKPLAARHDRGTTWARHGHGMICVNRPLVVPSTPLESSLATAYKRVIANWTSFGSRSLIGNLGKSHVFDHEVERTVAALFAVCEN